MQTAEAQPRRFDRLRRRAALLRLRPFDTSTEVGRAQERHRRIALSAAASLAAKLVHSICVFVTVPLAVGYLGNERYGVWMTIVSIIAMLAFSDLGMGNGLISELADAHGRQDLARSRRIVSSATFILLPIAVGVGILFLIVYPFVPWARVFNAHSAQAISESGPAIAVCMLLFLLSLPLNVVQSVHLGYQEGFVPNIVQAAISVCSLIGLWLAVKWNMGLVGITALWAGSSIVVRGINGLYLFGKQKRWLMPAWRDFEWPVAARLLKVSFLYMIIGMSIAVGNTSDSMVLTQLIGPEAVTQYNIPYRLFSIVTVVMSFFLTPLWPAYAEAAARGDVKWVKITLRRSLVIGLALNIAAAVVLLIFGKWAVRVLGKGQVETTYVLLLAFSCYLIVTCLHTPLSMLLNGLSIIRFQFVCWISMAILNLGLSILLTKRFGVSGVVFGTVIANFVCFVIPSAWYARRYLRQMTIASAK